MQDCRMVASPEGIAYFRQAVVSHFLGQTHRNLAWSGNGTAATLGQQISHPNLKVLCDFLLDPIDAPVFDAEAARKDASESFSVRRSDAFDLKIKLSGWISSKNSKEAHQVFQKYPSICREVVVVLWNSIAIEHFRSVQVAALPAESHHFFPAK